MITAQDIKDKAAKRYTRYLSALVAGEPFEKLVIPGDKKPNENLEIYEKELKNLRSLSKEVKGFGYSIEWQTVHKKSIGTQDIPQQIYFDTEKDFLKFLQKEQEAKIFQKNIATILLHFPELKDWLYKYPQKVVEQAELWPDLLKVLCYFRNNPHPHLYIRELPIDVHTKFVENHEGILKSLLDVVIAEHVNWEEYKLAKRYSLKDVEPLIRLRILDKRISQAYFQGIDDLSIPINQLSKLDWNIKRVFIVENLINLLTFPIVEDSLIIWGHGYGVANLKEIAFLKTAEIYYWGDLDAQGFEILSQFRGYFPQTESLLMDATTFQTFFVQNKGKESHVSTKLHLTPEENELYQLLKKNNWRLEQEKIPLKYTIEKVLLKLHSIENRGF